MFRDEQETRIMGDPLRSDCIRCPELLESVTRAETKVNSLETWSIRFETSTMQRFDNLETKLMAKMDAYRNGEAQQDVSIAEIKKDVKWHAAVWAAIVSVIAWLIHWVIG